jgi:hypothetical protein
LKFWDIVTGYHPKAKLAKFGQKQNKKVKKHLSTLFSILLLANLLELDI